MSSVSVAGAASMGARRDRRVVVTPEWQVRLLLLAVALAAFFYNWLSKQAQHSVHKSADWGHVFLIPAISVYILLQRKGELAERRPAPFWPGLLILLLGIACYPYFIVGFPNHFGQGASLVMCVYGLCLLLAGPEITRLATFPILYLLFAITVPEMVMNKLTFPLQLLGSKGAWIMLNTCGMTTDLAGNTLTVYDSAGGGHPLNVAEACSGMRTLVAFIALSVAVALVGCTHWWQRVVVVCAGIPVALALNIVRIFVLGVVSLFDDSLAAGEAHTLIGTVLLAIGFLIFMGIVWALNRSVRDTAPLGAPR